MPRKEKSRTAPPRRRAAEATKALSAELLARWSSGDQDAAGEIFERYVDRLTRLARVRLSVKLAARMDADDVVMSAYRSFFVGARDGRFSLKESGDLWRLLAAITIHKLCRAAAHHRALRRSVAKEAAADTDAPPREFLSREPAPDEVAAAADELEAVFAQLPPLGRRVLELRLRGESIEAIAKETERSAKTVRRWLAEAKRLFLARQTVDPAPVSRRRERRPLMPAPSDEIQEMPPISRRRLPRRLLKYDDYVLRRLIGSGATGKVYLATCRSSSSDVAVKFLRKSFLRRPHVVARFVDEAAVLARLKHRGIVRLHGLGKTRHDGYFIVMDLGTGGDLAQRIVQGPIAFADAARWTAEAAEAIQYAHEQGVVHCDLKPSNLLLHADGHVIVTDFGMARDECAIDVSTTAIAGTPAFMAPEQIADCYGPIGRHTDLYGLGAVLYTLLTGQPPFADTDAVAIFAKIIAGQSATPPDCLRRDIPPMLTRVCMGLLEKRPDSRITHAGALARNLRNPTLLTRR